MKTPNFFLIALLLLVITSCSKDDEPVVKSKLKELTSFVIKDIEATVDEQLKTVAITLPVGTTVTALKATAEISEKASISPDPTTAIGYSNPKEFTVTAEDGTTQKYIVTVTVLSAASTEKSITKFTIEGVDGVIDESSKTIAVSLPSGTSKTRLTATGVISDKASISPDPTLATTDYSTPVTYTVTAEDGTTQEYVVTCNIVIKNGAPYGNAGEHTAVKLSEATDNPPYGFYEYLPIDFSPSSSKKYPLLIFYHGIGQKGNGSEDLSKVLVNGPPKLIKNGKDFEAIVISPQSPNGWFGGNSFLSLYNYLIKNYPIDINRVYVTGLSAGGGGTWKALESHHDKIAAAVPICGANRLVQPADFLINSKIWAFHNFEDKRVGRATTIDNVNRVANTGTSVMAVYPYGDGSRTVANEDYTMHFNTDTDKWSTNQGINKPNQNMAFTMYKLGGHDAWTKTYNNEKVWDWLFAQSLK
ncbi:DUF5018 domain-containing protein [Aquimarina algiphila]|uniref:DUF5018 domain-containing protein n=1 Tax=Aquimarina algiphila TaxID=2047982 RepID=A0A554VP16_9FLAO|nr:DUF5018 domain-containing protein [Aquimarina algiphila]TSE10130.1 DUF5018 domain-containing protein [Aquimarina algiphila]